MKKEYIKPELEEIELVLEGSFLNYKTGDENTPDIPIEGGEEGGDDWN